MNINIRIFPFKGTVGNLVLLSLHRGSHRFSNSLLLESFINFLDRVDFEVSQRLGL